MEGKLFTWSLSRFLSTTVMERLSIPCARERWSEVRGAAGGAGEGVGTEGLGLVMEFSTGG